ncbi:hypothetical protein COCSUDRAFT_57112 [Coccomyxa subellipsoidea C-169]|uniref:Kinesin motor domain-containing protein n=1 Tax=Coccomyxa subellipsoidea (strain C-169) TaxID=574566 RepID=I0YS31_COCSC|nr:hypothetical protein COCSUDRAFT_57112 [Coccomyxa subellipsoidea C-169]EIE21200.1 hypothetical protein COCSUDRAFT_57112 [Coccomyxa subellipsoidea C-169]|eukprot:XP_005645744.1 hypothetical protein COCSUDRAFT_57112 [Coccomyxa subellipsoidea C-169]
MALLIRSCMDGCKPCIFASAQTGSGKTRTVQGPPQDLGWCQRTLRHSSRPREGTPLTTARRQLGRHISIASQSASFGPATALLACGSFANRLAGMHGFLS